MKNNDYIFETNYDIKLESPISHPLAAAWSEDWIKTQPARLSPIEGELYSPDVDPAGEYRWIRITSSSGELVTEFVIGPSRDLYVKKDRVVRCDPYSTECIFSAVKDLNRTDFNPVQIMAIISAMNIIERRCKEEEG